MHRHNDPGHGWHRPQHDGGLHGAPHFAGHMGPGGPSRADVRREAGSLHRPSGPLHGQPGAGAPAARPILNNALHVLSRFPGPVAGPHFYLCTRTQEELPEGTPNTLWVVQLLGAYVWVEDDVVAPLLPDLAESGWPYGWDRDDMGRTILRLPLGKYEPGEVPEPAVHAPASPQAPGSSQDHLHAGAHRGAVEEAVRRVEEAAVAALARIGATHAQEAPGEAAASPLPAEPARPGPATTPPAGASLHAPPPKFHVAYKGMARRTRSAPPRLHGIDEPVVDNLPSWWGPSTGDETPPPGAIPLGTPAASTQGDEPPLHAAAVESAVLEAQQILLDTYVPHDATGAPLQEAMAARSYLHWLARELLRMHDRWVVETAVQEILHAAQPPVEEAAAAAAASRSEVPPAPTSPEVQAPPPRAQASSAPDWMAGEDDRAARRRAERAAAAAEAAVPPWAAKPKAAEQQVQPQQAPDPAAAQAPAWKPAPPQFVRHKAPLESWHPPPNPATPAHAGETAQRAHVKPAPHDIPPAQLPPKGPPPGLVRPKADAAGGQGAGAKSNPPEYYEARMRQRQWEALDWQQKAAAHAAARADPPPKPSAPEAQNAAPQPPPAPPSDAQPDAGACPDVPPPPAGQQAEPAAASKAEAPVWADPPQTAPPPMRFAQMFAPGPPPAPLHGQGQPPPRREPATPKPPSPAKPPTPRMHAKVPPAAKRMPKAAQTRGAWAAATGNAPAQPPPPKIWPAGTPTPTPPAGPARPAGTPKPPATPQTPLQTVTRAHWVRQGNGDWHWQEPARP